MASFFDKIAKPLGIGLGAAALGSVLFPQTTSMLTGGLFGSDTGTGLLSGGGAGGAAQYFMPGGAPEAESIWRNPTVLSSGILAGTSLLSGLFGTDQEEANLALKQAALDEEKRQFDAKMGLEKDQLAQAIEIARIQAGSAGRAAGISAAAQRAIAEANAIQNAATTKAQALQIPLASREKQAEAAQNTGVQSGAFINALTPTLIRPMLRG